MSAVLIGLCTVGLLGIVLLVPSLIEIRVYFGTQAQGIGPVLVDALLLSQFLLILAAVALVIYLTPWNPPPPLDGGAALALTCFFAVKPFVTYVRLYRWRNATPQERDTRTKEE